MKRYLNSDMNQRILIILIKKCKNSIYIYCKCNVIYFKGKHKQKTLCNIYKGKKNFILNKINGITFFNIYKFLCNKR